jgi:DNA-binding transcriptional MerR regulator
MRIGELAGLVGISTRSIRHYHHVGLLPEPARTVNGYREYSLRDAIELARVRRLTELGLSLDEVGDALARDAGRDLTETLRELDADLARQEAGLRQRRARLAELLRQGEAGGKPAEQAPVSPGLTELFDRMARIAAEQPGPEPAMAVKDRDLMALLETAQDKVAVRLRIHGTHSGEFLGIAATGRAIDYVSHEFYRVADGLLAEEWICSDMASLLRQLS